MDWFWGACLTPLLNAPLSTEGDWLLYPLLSTNVGPNYELLQFEGDGVDVADAFCVSRGYALAGAFSEFTGVSSVWAVGTTNLANNESWTGYDATGYLYITCLTSETQDPNIANSTNGNIGADNVRGTDRGVVAVP